MQRAPDHRRVPGADIAPDQRFGRECEAVHHVRKEREELHQQRIDRKHHIAHTRRCGRKESIDYDDTGRAQENIAVDAEKPQHRPHIETRTKVDISDETAVIDQPQRRSGSQAAVLRHDRTPCDARDPPVQAVDEPEPERDVQQVDDDRNVHRETRILHADKPTLEREERQRSGRGPQPHIEILGRLAHRLRSTVHHPESEVPHPVTGNEQQQRNGKRNAYRTDEHRAHFAEIARTVGLRHEPAGSHAQEGEIPVDEVEDGHADGHRADQRIDPQVTDDGHIDHAHQRHGNVRNNIGNRQCENLPVHGAKVTIFRRFAKFSE